MTSHSDTPSKLSKLIEMLNDMDGYPLTASQKDELISELSALTAQLAEVIMKHAMATGHGDSAADMLRELDWQLTERDAQLAEALQDAEIGRKWRENSSLEEWFPFTAQELAEARRDAERYRWLKNYADNEFTDREDCTPVLIAKDAKFSNIGWSVGIDEAIDRARSAK